MPALDFLHSPKGRLSLALVIWFLVMLGLGTGNIGNPNLWFDEALQVWASLGQGHYTNYDTALDHSVRSALKANYSSTWDPPGLSLLMHLLGKISQQLWIFRSLTLFFMFAGAFLLSRLALRWRPQHLLSYSSGLLLFASSLLCHYAFELRPYSMELLHALLAVYLTCSFETDWSRKKTLLLGTLLALCMASRYTSVFPALLCAGLLFIKCFYEPEQPNVFVFPRKKLEAYLLLFFPSLVIGLALCSGLILIKNLQWNMATNNDAYHLLFLSANAPGELFNWATLLLWLPLLALLALRWLPLRLFPELARKYDGFVVFVLLFNILRLLLDWAQYIPYSLSFRFNLPCHALLLFSYIPLTLLIFEYCSLKYEANPLAERLQTLCGAALVLLILVKALAFTRIDEDQSIAFLSSLEPEPAPKILAAVNTYPGLRYAFEFGALRERRQWRDKLYYYGSRQPKHKDWVVSQKFDFIGVQHGGMNEEYYRLAKQKQYDYILEGHTTMRENGKRQGFSTVIVKLN